MSDEDVEAVLGPKAFVGHLAAAGAEKLKERHLKEVQERGYPPFWGGVQAGGIVYQHV
jgi:hypothetical protein